MIQFMLSTFANLYVAVLNAKIFGQSINTVAVKILLAVGLYVIAVYAWKRFCALFEAHKPILLPALVGYSVWISYVHFAVR